MAERSEGSRVPGGPISHIISPSSKARNISGGVSYNSRAHLPLRKRKFDLENFSVESTSASSPLEHTNIHSSVSSSKRRKTHSNKNEGHLKEDNCADNKHSEYLPKTSRFDIYFEGQRPSRSHRSSSAIDKLPKRKSSRGAYPIGFYAEEEQKSLAAFRDRTSELRSKGEDLVSSVAAEPHLTRSSFRKAASTTSRAHKKMNDRSSEENSPNIACLNRTSDSVRHSVSKRKPRRHTLPGKGPSKSDMGVSLSKCLVSDAQVSEQVRSDTPRASTSGMSASGGVETLSGSSSSVIDQLMKRLPLKKKSNSEQDLQQLSQDSVARTLSRESSSFRKVDDRRRHLDSQLKRSSHHHTDSASFMNNEQNNASQSSGTSSLLKLYPLRNRLRLSDGSVSTPSTELSTSLPLTDSQSLPSSPSAPAVPFLETFRRLRDPRRHESGQKRSQSTKESKQSSSSIPWKRTYNTRKSPVTSKKSKGKSNSSNSSSRGLPNSSLGLPYKNVGRVNQNGAGPKNSANANGQTSSSISIPLSATVSGSSNASSLSNSTLNYFTTGMGNGSHIDPTASSSGAASLNAGLASFMLPGDSESEENDVTRLEALLAARGLPPGLFGALGPRMQHFLHRSVSSSIHSKAQQLLLGLQATDESEQLQAVIEMCQLLVMGNEDTLAGFPMKQVTPALITLLNMEHNFDMMNHACRALTYMMEALPRSSSVVVDAVPAFLQKLQAIQCMDVAEQSLTALNMLSRKHSKAILQAHGVNSCLMFIDFFSTNAQRAALSITANCFQNLTADEFHFASVALQTLSNRLAAQGDKKCVESVCLAFSRLVDCFHNDSNKLQEIASYDLLNHIQALLVMSPPVLQCNTFIMVIRMLSVMCSNCPKLAVTLLENNIAQTLCFLLTNSADPPVDSVELISRTPQEFYEITSLISELMPALPTTGIFSIDAIVQKPSMAHQAGDYETSISLNKSSFTLDLHAMQQIDDATGAMRIIQRKINPSSDEAPSTAQIPLPDPRAECLTKKKDLAFTLLKSLFSLLHEIYSACAGPTVRYKCLISMLRMIHFSGGDLLQQVLKSQTVSSHLAAMLSSPDMKIVVGAMQITSMLIEKLPQEFSVYFRREGVMHQVKRLCDTEAINSQFLNSKSPPDSEAPKIESSSEAGINLSSSIGSMDSRLFESASESQIPSMRICDVIRQKRRPTKSSTRASSSSSKKSNLKAEEINTPTFSEMLMKTAGFSKSSESSWKNHGRIKLMPSSSNPNPPMRPSNPSTHSRFALLSSLNPTKWGRSISSPGSSESQSNKWKSSTPTTSGSSMETMSPSTSSMNREVVKNWLKDQANRLDKENFGSDCEGFEHPALTVLNRLITAVNQLDPESSSSLSALKEIGAIMKKSDISPFEVIHSGLVKALLIYLTSPDKTDPLDFVEDPISLLPKSNKESSSIQTKFSCLPRETRILNFIHVFLSCSLNIISGNNTAKDTSFFEALIGKMNGCVNQLEQFPVKVHDLPGAGVSGSGRGGPQSAIKFFNTHQLKCNLQRYPDCSRLKQWRGGAVKVDPLALVQAIERYLLIRGYGRVRDDDDENSDDDNSDDDIDDSLAPVSGTNTSPGHKLQFLIGDNVLPYNMTVYQAVRMYSQDASTSEGDTDSETPVSQSAIWLQTHTIYYRPIQDNIVKAPPTRKGKSSKQSPKRKDSLYSDPSILGNSYLLDEYLVARLPANVSVRDPSLEVLALLRVLYAINRYYGALYPPGPFKQPLELTDFINQKLTAKANRQLQDPLVIMTGNLPQWLPQIVYACPFMFPFEARQLLFYATTFDRDRTLTKLIESGPELQQDMSERVMPRTERRKRTINREDILKQAESVINELATSRAMLEFQYENEVGTGLGPTLEFYALVSRELHKAELELWRGETILTDEESIKEKPVKQIRMVSSSSGLFPMPISKNLKSAQVTKLKSKFKFIGKLMAKAVMDSRMLDVRLHDCVYKWLLGQERSLGLSDVMSLDPVMGQTLSLLHSVYMEKKRTVDQAKASGVSSADLQEKIDALTVDGCRVEDLALNFTLPGYPNIELKKGGNDIEVTINNIEQYLHAVVEWIVRDGVWRQMESMREGFESVFPISQLQVFYPEEMEQVFCGCIDDRSWDIKQLAECCRPDHGYNHNSRAVKYLLEILSEYTPKQQRGFTQFVTGSPRLPVGGFKSLNPPLTIVRKTFESGQDPDNFLPSVMTCVNYLKLPDYSSIEVMRNKLDLAIKEGQRSFHLS